MPRRVRFTKLPVIKPPQLPEGVPDLSTLEKLPFELVIIIMLSLDALNILRLCSVSSTIRETCKLEWFWKQKTIHDFDLTDNFEIDPNDTWKNFYLNQVNPIRELKQLIRAGKVESFDALISGLLPHEDVDESMDESIHDLMDFAITEKQFEIAYLIMGIIQEKFIPHFNTLCLLAQTPRAINFFKEYFQAYIETVLFPLPSLYDDTMMLDLPSWYDLMMCVIESKKKTLVELVYSKLLNWFGSNHETEARIFVKEAETSGNEAMIQTINDTYDSYVRGMKDFHRRFAMERGLDVDKFLEERGM